MARCAGVVGARVDSFGALPCVELGRHRRYERTAVEEWIDACRRPGRPIMFRGGRPGRGA